jgi:MFS family permease
VPATATRLPTRLVTILAAATGLAVANNYYAQPLLPAIASDLGLPGATAGLIVTVSQLGYAAGLVLLLPLGDLVERRRLVVTLGVGAAVALALTGAAPTGAVLLPAAVLVGVLSVQSEIYRLAPEARSRINSAYMTSYFAGGALGSAGSAAAFDAGGRAAVPRRRPVRGDVGPRVGAQPSTSRSVASAARSTSSLTSADGWRQLPST